MGKNQYVVRHGKDWAVRGEGNARLTSVHGTQADAIDAARRTAQKEHSELVIQGRDTKIRDKDSFGPDPYPPKDRKH